MAKYALVQAGFGAPERQSRWKIGFRFILAIPIDLWLFVLSVWGVFLIIIGWFCALVLGRMPFAIAQYLSNLIVRQTRANSYIYLMNDAYPPFSAKADFGVNVMIPITKVRRFAVLFRYILLFPAFLVQGLVTVDSQSAPFSSGSSFWSKEKCLFRYLGRLPQYSDSRLERPRTP